MTSHAIQGAKGGSKPHTPYETPDSLINTSYANLLDAISEGPIVGLVNGAQSIYLDQTPLANADGSLNFSGVTWEQRTGEADQDYITGFPAVETEHSVGVELKADQPWTQAINNLELSGVRLQLGVSTLYQQQSNGDTNGYTVNYVIELSTDGGDFVQVLASAFSGKTTTGYQRSHRVDLPAATEGWTIRVRRTTPDATQSTTQANTSVASYTEVIDAKLQYPYTALVGIKIDASQFSNIPERAFRIRGRIVQVPSNYDAATRTYTGSWDGTFKLSWTDCPPWIYRDIIVNDRYGLGRYISDNQVDKWELYSIAQYCDEMVSDGKGGQEPRFACNVYLQTRADALQVLQDLASVFRGMSYYAASQVIASADMPSDPVYTYTNSNVIDGRFSRAGSSGSTRYSVAKVSWTNRENFGEQKVEYVPSREAIARYGIRETEVNAFGCCSQGQAQRMGHYILLTNQLETETVSFSVGLDGTLVRPGSIIRVADQNYAGKPIGGRLKAATSDTVTVDDDLTVAAGDTLVVIQPNGVAQTRVIESVAGRVITVTESFDAAPIPESIYAVETAEVVAETYRVLTVTENFGDDKLQYDVVAIQYNSSKFAAIDSGAQIVTPPTTALPAAVQAPPTNVELTTFDAVQQGLTVATMRITWTPPKGAQSYNVWWKRDSGDWIYAGVAYTAAIEVLGIYSGVYTARVAAIGVGNATSIWATSEATQLYGKTGSPPVLASFTTASELFGIRMNWEFPEGAEDTFCTEVQQSEFASGESPTQLSLVSYPGKTYLKSGMAAGVTGYFRARLMDRTGNTGEWTDWVFGQSSADADAILDYITGQITESQLGQDLLSEIDKISGDGEGSVNERLDGIDKALQDQISAMQSQLDDVLGTPDWDSGQDYLTGSLVKEDGKLYRAIQDVPAGTAVTDASYWEYIGDYESIGDTVAALAVRVDSVETSVEDIDGELAAMATRMIGVEAQVFPHMAGDTGWLAGDEGVNATAYTVYSAIADGDSALSQRLDLVEASVGDNLDAKIQEETTARVDADEALAEQITTVSARFDDADAALQEEITARANADEAFTEQMTTLQSQIGDTVAQVSDTAQAVIDLEGNVSATRTIKVGVDQNGQYYAAGMGIGVENTEEGIQSIVTFLADRFAVMSQVNGTPQTMFDIEDGQTVIRSAFISQAQIMELIVSGELKSPDYVQGQTGISINFLTGELEINKSTSTGRTTINGGGTKVWSGNIDVVTLGELS